MKKIQLLLAVIGSVFLLSACGPAPVEPIKEIKPNETAFVVPLEGASKAKQGQFMSLDYLEANKVAAKRVVIPIRKRTTGRGPGNYEWIPTVKVITVDRTPVTREWTDSSKTGSSSRNDGFRVESQDSIGFVLGGTLTARVTEANASAFLYNYAGRPLRTVIDQNVRGYLQAYLTNAFGRLSLTECKKQKGEIFDAAYIAVVAKYEPFGVTIDTFGPSQGLKYTNVAIQQAIDDAYKAEMMIIQRRNEKTAQDEDNKRIKAAADTKLYEARKFAQAEKAQEKMISLEIQRMRAEAAMVQAKRWDGKLPAKILPANSNLLMNMN